MKLSLRKNKGSNMKKLSLRKRKKIQYKGGAIGQTQVQTAAQPTSQNNLVLRLKQPDEHTDVNVPVEAINIEQEKQNLKTKLSDLQDFIFDTTESNFEYFSMQSYNDYVSGVVESMFTLRRQEGGGDCNGELLLSNDGSIQKSGFTLLSSLKNFVEIKHDFKPGDKRNNTLNYENEILAASRSVMNHLNKNRNMDPKVESFYDYVMEKYLDSSTKEEEREQLYMRRVIEFMDGNCHLTNTLNISKYISDSKDHGRRYIQNKIKENKKDRLLQTTGKNGTPELLYLSTVNNEAVTPIFSEDQVKFAFTDNSISDIVMYPHVHNVERINDAIAIVDEPLSAFKNIMQMGKINTVPSFMDPANLSPTFLSEQIISDDMDKTNAIRRRVQELQNLEDPYSLPFVLVLMDTINDFFSYYGSILRVKPIDLNDKMSKMFYDECLNYISTGIKNTATFNATYLQTMRNNFPIYVGSGTESGFVYFNVVGKKQGNNIYNNTLQLYIQDTTIASISSFMNKTAFFPRTPSEMSAFTMELLDSKRGLFTNSERRIYNFSKAIFDNIVTKNELQNNIKSVPYTSKNVDASIQLFLIILVSLKAFGDASQVNYSRRMNDLLKNSSIKFPMSVGIRTTDKNVFAESLLHNNPVWFMNNGIKPHISWIQRLVGDDSIDFDSHKVFITNNERGDDKLYYSEIIKNMNRYRLYSGLITGGVTTRSQAANKSKKMPMKATNKQNTSMKSHTSDRKGRHRDNIKMSKYEQEQINMINDMEEKSRKRLAARRKDSMSQENVPDLSTPELKAQQRQYLKRPPPPPENMEQSKISRNVVPDLSTPELKAQQRQYSKRPPMPPSSGKQEVSATKSIPTVDKETGFIQEDVNFELTVENLMKLKALMMNVYESRLRDNRKLEEIFTLNTSDSNDVLKNVLFEANVFSSIMNDYMKHVEYLENGRTHLHSLFMEYNNKTLQIARILNKIANEAGGYKNKQSSLEKNIASISNIPEYGKINKFFNGLKLWTRENLNDKCVENLRRSMIQFNSITQEFINDLPSAFQEEMQGRTSGRTQRISYTESSDKSTILQAWSSDNRYNRSIFKELIHDPYNAMVQEINSSNIGENNIQQVFEEFHGNDGIPFTDILEDINESFILLNQYEDMMNDDVNNEVIQTIHSTTANITSNFNKLKSYKYIPSSQWRQKSKNNFVLTELHDFFYRPVENSTRYQKVFDRFMKLFKQGLPNFIEKSVQTNRSQFEKKLEESKRSLTPQTIGGRRTRKKDKKGKRHTRRNNKL